MIKYRTAAILSSLVGQRSGVIKSLSISSVAFRIGTSKNIFRFVEIL